MRVLRYRSSPGIFGTRKNAPEGEPPRASKWRNHFSQLLWEKGSSFKQTIMDGLAVPFTNLSKYAGNDKERQEKGPFRRPPRVRRLLSLPSLSPGLPSLRLPGAKACAGPTPRSLRSSRPSKGTPALDRSLPDVFHAHGVGVETRLAIVPGVAVLLSARQALRCSEGDLYRFYEPPAGVPTDGAGGFSCSGGRGPLRHC